MVGIPTYKLRLHFKLLTCSRTYSALGGQSRGTQNSVPRGRGRPQFTGVSTWPACQGFGLLPAPVHAHGPALPRTGAADDAHAHAEAAHEAAVGRSEVDAVDDSAAWSQQWWHDWCARQRHSYNGNGVLE
jgi:hypothetical protein